VLAIVYSLKSVKQKSFSDAEICIPDPIDVEPLQRHLISSNWPISHGSSNNLDSSHIDIETKDIKFESLKVNIQTLGNPTSVIQGHSEDNNMTFWTSGRSVVYTGKIDENGIPSIMGELSRGEKDIDDIFHGSYAFCTNKEGNNPSYFYASFKNTLERYWWDEKCQIIARNICFLKGLDPDDNLIALNLTYSGYIVLGSKKGIVYVSKTNLMLKDEDFNMDSFNYIDLRQQSFFDDFGKFGLIQGGNNYRSRNFDTSEIVYNNQSLASTLWISNSIGIGPPNSDFKDYAYIPTCVGVVAIDCIELASRSSWDVVKSFFAVPRVQYNTSKPFENFYLLRLGPMGTGASPTTFTIGGNDFLTITDGISPMGLCIYRLPGKQGGNRNPDIYQRIKFGNEDDSTSEQSLAVYINEDSVDIFVVNNYIGTNGYIDLGVKSLTGQELTTRQKRIVVNQLIAAASVDTAKSSSFDLRTGKGQSNISSFGFSGKGTQYYRFTSSGNKDNLDLLWENNYIYPTTTIPLITNKYVWVIGFIEDPESNVPNEYYHNLDLQYTNRLIGISRNTGRIEIAKSLIIGGYELEPALQNMTSQTIYAGIGVFKNENKNRLVFGIISGIGII